MPNKKIDTINKLDVFEIRQGERPEYRSDKNKKLRYVVFRTRDKYRRQTRYIGKNNKEFKFYEKAFDLGIYNSMENRRKNAQRRN